jgi:predicted CDP-diglyceride synthetase/phosphatidate cytidylyltransferase
MVIMLAIAVSIGTNILALYGISNVIQRFKVLQNDVRIDRSLRKAYISRKKREAVATQVRKIRGMVSKLTLFHFLIPFSAYILALVLYTILSIIIFKEYVMFVYVHELCLAPIPIAYPFNNTCTVSIMWLHFLIFITFFPLYDYLTKKYLGE